MQTAPVHERYSASYSASGKPRLRSYLRRCFAEISARTQYPAPNPKKNTARINKDDMKSFDWFGSTRDSSESSSAAASCCSRSNEQHRDPHDEIQPAGRRKTDGGQIIDDHPFASHRRTPFSTKPSSRSDAGSLTSQISWPRCLGLQGCFSNANPMP